MEHMLDEFARQRVGDGNEPNIFFVSREGRCVAVTVVFSIAYQIWQEIARTVSVTCELEDRLNGCLASVEPVNDHPAARLVKYDVNPEDLSILENS